jgi:hypothetical protein
MTKVVHRRLHLHDRECGLAFDLLSLYLNAFDYPHLKG